MASWISSPPTPTIATPAAKDRRFRKTTMPPSISQLPQQLPCVLRDFFSSSSSSSLFLPLGIRATWAGGRGRAAARGAHNLSVPVMHGAHATGRRCAGVQKPARACARSKVATRQLTREIQFTWRPRCGLSRVACRSARSRGAENSTPLGFPSSVRTALVVAMAKRGAAGQCFAVKISGAPRRLRVARGAAATMRR